MLSGDEPEAAFFAYVKNSNMSARSSSGQFMFFEIKKCHEWIFRVNIYKKSIQNVSKAVHRTHTPIEHDAK